MALRAPIDGIGLKSHFKHLTPLQAPQQKPSLDTTFLGKSRRFHFAMQPNERLVLRAHGAQYISKQTWRKSHLTHRWSARVENKVPSSTVGARAAQLNRQATV